MKTSNKAIGLAVGAALSLAALNSSAQATFSPKKDAPTATTFTPTSHIVEFAPTSADIKGAAKINQPNALEQSLTQAGRSAAVVPTYRPSRVFGLPVNIGSTSGASTSFKSLMGTDKEKGADNLLQKEILKYIGQGPVVVAFTDEATAQKLDNDLKDKTGITIIHIDMTNKDLEIYKKVIDKNADLKTNGYDQAAVYVKGSKVPYSYAVANFDQLVAGFHQAAPAQPPTHKP